MEDKLKTIFDFLVLNRKYNHELQKRFYSSIIKPYDNNQDKIISVFYNIANTQSQPNIDKLSIFYKEIFQNIDCLNSFESFIVQNRPVENISITYDGLFKTMTKKSGWGDKTAALFAKTIFHLHNNLYSNEFKIWDDAPTTIDDKDNFYLPVDSVIIAIFNRMSPNVKWNFYKVNEVLRKIYKPSEMEIWDDLWFWGFITQKGSGDNRNFEWNENKYWTLKESDKIPNNIAEIHEKSNDFLGLLSCLV